MLVRLFQHATMCRGPSRTTVTDALGNATTYEWAPVAHIKRLTTISGPRA